MTLKPLPQQMITADRLDRLADELRLEAAALRAECYEYKPTRQHDWRAEMKRIKEMK